jgi:hypothetical protein
VSDQGIGNIEFHDAVVTAVARHGRDLVLTIDLVEPSGRGRLVLRGVGAIRIDEAPADEVLCDGDDGEILRLDRVDGGIELFILWMTYRSRREISRFYQIACADAVWVADA